MTYLGIDIGTSGVKALLMDRSGNRLERAEPIGLVGRRHQSPG
jgi:sugar (pentulose or hexulose) kinase